MFLIGEAAAPTSVRAERRTSISPSEHPAEIAAIGLARRSARRRLTGLSAAAETPYAN